MSEQSNGVLITQVVRLMLSTDTAIGLCYGLSIDSVLID